MHFSTSRAARVMDAFKFAPSFSVRSWRQSESSASLWYERRKCSDDWF